MAVLRNIFAVGNQEAGCNCDNIAGELSCMPLEKLYQGDFYEEEDDDNLIDGTIWGEC